MIRAELRPECTLTLPCIYAILVIAVCAGSRAGFAAGNYTDAAFDRQNGREGIGMKFEERVLRHDDQLNETDDDIVSYIRSHRQEIMKLSIQKIAADLFIAPNAVMRLSKKLEYSGFSELKFSVQNEGEPEGTGKTISGRILGQLPSNIVKTLDTIDVLTLKKAAAMMKKARCCIFAGVGDSTYFCEMLGKNLRCLDCSVQFYQQIHDMFYAVRHGSRDDLLIIISARGENDRLIEMAGEAKAMGMPVVSITHFYENRLAKACDVNLYFWGEDREVQGYNVTDRSGLMVLVRLLSEEFWQGYVEP